MVGYIVKTKGAYNFGQVEQVFSSWSDLKSKCVFETFDDDTLGVIERMISDPRDRWLNAQSIIVTESEINGRWISMKRLFGGSSWIPFDRIEVIISTLN